MANQGGYTAFPPSPTGEYQGSPTYPNMGYNPSQGYQGYPNSPGYPPHSTTHVVVAPGATGGNKCPFCNEFSGNVVRSTCGCVACAWAIGLFLTIPFLTCLPCCVDGCRDKELVCPSCGGVKSIIPANCC